MRRIEEEEIERLKQEVSIELSWNLWHTIRPGEAPSLHPSWTSISYRTSPCFP